MAGNITTCNDDQVVSTVISNEQKEKQQLQQQQQQQQENDVSDNNTKSVSFHRKVRVVKISKSPRAYTTKEINKRWYSIQELEDLKRETRRTIVYMKLLERTNELRKRGDCLEEEDDDSFSLPDGFCSRGLEWKTNQGIKKFLFRKHAIRKAVLNEQDRQRKNGNGAVDPYQLAMVYSRLSSESSEEAHFLALEDQMEVIKPSMDSSIMDTKESSKSIDDDNKTKNENLALPRSIVRSRSSNMKKVKDNTKTQTRPMKHIQTSKMNFKVVLPTAA